MLFDADGALSPVKLRKVQVDGEDGASAAWPEDHAEWAEPEPAEAEVNTTEIQSDMVDVSLCRSLNCTQGPAGKPL